MSIPERRERALQIALTMTNGRYTSASELIEAAIEIEHYMLFGAQEEPPAPPPNNPFEALAAAAEAIFAKAAAEASKS